MDSKVFSSSSASRQMASNSILINTKEIEWEKIRRTKWLNRFVDLLFFATILVEWDSRLAHSHTCPSHMHRADGESSAVWIKWRVISNRFDVSSSSKDHITIVVRSFVLLWSAHLIYSTLSVYIALHFLFLLFRIELNFRGFKWNSCVCTVCLASSTRSH